MVTETIDKKIVLDGPAKGEYWCSNKTVTQYCMGNRSEKQLINYYLSKNGWTIQDTIKPHSLIKHEVKETVNHPSHYNQYGVECIDVAEQMNFNLGNALKYIWRCGDKENPIEDLKKAKWYIERELQRIENE